MRRYLTALLACFGILFVVGTMSGCATTSVPMDKEQKVALGLIGATSFLSLAFSIGSNGKSEPNWPNCHYGRLVVDGVPGNEHDPVCDGNNY